jgi:AraC-like DNA-binding protein
MRRIPLIHAEHVIRVARLLDANGIPADRYLERARLWPGLREHPTGFVPGHSVWALVGETDDGEALGEFWLDIARISNWRRAGWVPPLAHAAILGDAIRAMCRSYVRQIPMNRLGLTLDGDVAWFWRRRVCDVHDWPGNQPAEQYTLSFMLEVVRAAARPDWLPPCVQVQCSPSGWPAATKRLPGVRIEYDRPMLALAIPVPLLALPISIRPLAAPGAECAWPAPDFQGSLRQVLEPCFEGGLPGQETAAEMLWTTPRTLRRRLAEEGTSWHRVVNDLKFARAVERLQESRFPVREIAAELGYTDAAHFTRFFRQRAGVPPSAYRASIEHARELARRAPS